MVSVREFGAVYLFGDGEFWSWALERDIMMLTMLQVSETAYFLRVVE